MLKIIIALGLLCTALWVWMVLQRPPPNAPPAPEDRVALARGTSEALIRKRFEKTGLSYPARDIFLRAFKREQVLELWAREDSLSPYQLVASFPILAPSGNPGPKSKEGDGQVPEGFYVIDRFNPKSSFHLSLGLNYPNADDLLRADPTAPGSDIFIHGMDVSVGCLALGNAAIEELYLAATESTQLGNRAIPVDIFPARMSGPDWETFAGEAIGKNPELAGFWRQLKHGYDTFEEAHRRLEMRPQARH